jgi:hypothetical protein
MRRWQEDINQCSSRQYGKWYLMDTQG